MKPTFYGPRYATPSYTVQPRGEHTCMVTGDPVSAAIQVACYRLNRPDGTAIDVTYSEHCACCGGSGRTRSRRSTLAWKPCKACKGEPDVYSHTFTSEELKTFMRRHQGAWLAA